MPLEARREGYLGAAATENGEIIVLEVHSTLGHTLLEFIAVEDNPDGSLF